MIIWCCTLCGCSVVVEYNKLLEDNIIAILACSKD